MKIEQFCHSILQLGVKRSKALANLIMGLASQVFARSIVEISLSACFHYQFSSVNKAIDDLFSKEDYPEQHIETARWEVEKNFVNKEGLSG